MEVVIEAEFIDGHEMRYEITPKKKGLIQRLLGGTEILSVNCIPRADIQRIIIRNNKIEFWQTNGRSIVVEDLSKIKKAVILPEGSLLKR